MALCHTCRSRLFSIRHAVVPPLSAANNQTAGPLCHHAGAVNSMVFDGVGTVCSSPPWCGAVPRIVGAILRREGSLQ